MKKNISQSQLNPVYTAQQKRVHLPSVTNKTIGQQKVYFSGR
jgi:hypothetical protein